MFEVKQQGGGGYLYFSTEMNRQIQKRLQLETRLRNALTNNEFELYYQPQVRLRDARIVGVEALVRWRPEGEEDIVLPSSFISTAEETGLILPLSLWIITTACHQLKKFSFDKLKIDRSFIKEIDKKTKDKVLAKTMFTMGHGLGVSVVAEGVNSREQLAILTEQDCDIVQGFYYSEPLPAGGMTALLKTSRDFPSSNIGADLEGEV